jgi:NAD(P)-dependent dehydrogenase (short-subunit alcohol dehydrogenase family)/acyl carrier protein
MEPMLGAFGEVLRSLTFHEPRIGVVSLLSGVAGDPAVSSAGYWVRHAREAVRFADGMRAAAGAGCATFLELGPDGVLAGMGRDCVPDAAWVPSVRANRPEAFAVLEAAARVAVRGARVDWASLVPGGRVVDLPTYAFQHERFWLEYENPQHRASSGPDWRYQIQWTPVTDPAAPGFLSGTWLALVPPTPVPDPWVAAVTGGLAAAGARAEVLPVSPGIGRDELATLLAVVGEPAGVLSLLALADGPAVNAVVPAGLAVTTALTQALGDVGWHAPLWCVTREVVHTAADEEQAMIWGLGRVAALEHAGRWGGLVDLPATLSPAVSRRLAAVLNGATGEDQIAVRADGLYARRLTAVTEPPAPGTGAWEPAGTVLITGGTGRLGAHVARWLAARGARDLLLTSRSGPEAPGAAGLVAELAELGASVTVAACDVADAAALAALLATIPADRPLGAVFHAAGRIVTADLDATTTETMAEVLAGKVAGARNLTAQVGAVDRFVLFSSIAGVWGSGGHAAYAPANAHLDALAERRRAAGQHALAIAWGPWADGGMSAGAGTAREAARHGLPAMETSAALGALQSALDSGLPCVTVADVDWSRFVPVFTSTRPSRLFTALTGSVDAEPDGEAGPWLGRLRGRPGPERDAELLALVRHEVALTLGHCDDRAVDTDQAFRDLGLDSLAAVELRDRVAGGTGLTLASSLVFDHPTVQALARHLAGELGPDGGDPVATVLSRLDQLETAVAELDGGYAVREFVEPRLQALIARLAGRTGDQRKAVTDQLRAASVEDLYAFVDQELGR